SPGTGRRTPGGTSTGARAGTDARRTHAVGRQRARYRGLGICSGDRAGWALDLYTTRRDCNHQILFRRCHTVKPLRGAPPMTRKSIVSVLISLALSGVTAVAHAQLAGQTVAIGVAGPLTGGAAALGVEQKQAVEMAVDERNAAGGILGAQVVLVSADDKADAAEGKTLAQRFSDDPRLLGVVGHVNSGVTVEASNVYKACRLSMVTAMSSTPEVTDRGLENVFRLTNRNDNKGPAIAAYLYKTLGKRRAVVIDDQTAYGRDLAEVFAQSFVRAGGEVVKR